MNRLVTAAFAVLSALALSSCAGPAGAQASAGEFPAPSAAPVSVSPSPAALPNPVVEVEGSADFSQLGFIITPYQEASSIRYSIIASTVAQITFTANGDAYTYRAAKTNQDVSGVYETFDALPQSLDLEGPDFNVSVLIRTIGGGEDGALAEWEFEGVRYSLYTPDSTDYEALTDVLLPIIYVDLPFSACCG